MNSGLLRMACTRRRLARESTLRRDCRDNARVSAVRRRVIVRGHVQGVFFRESARRHAERAGVAGWIRNNADGSVEAVLEGEREDVERVVAFCRDGPRGAVVDGVEVLDEEPEGVRGFDVR